MNTEDYVSYPIAKSLKAAGFDWQCYHCYAKTSDNEHEFVGMTTIRNYNKPRDGEPPFLSPICSAPSLYHAQKWLREKHHISVRVSYLAYHKVWFADWLNLDSGEFDDTDATFATYEEALAEGICVVLELIEQENK